MPASNANNLDHGAPAPSAPLSPDAAVLHRWRAQPTRTSPWLHEEVARRMEARLDFMRKSPTSWAHWEPLRSGLQIHERLAQRYPDSRCFVVETKVGRAQEAIKSIAPWWRRTLGYRLPEVGLPADGVDMLWANMDLHLQPDPLVTLNQWSAALAPGGFVMFSCLGPYTLQELRAIYAALDWPPPAQTYTDMHDWGDVLLRSGFAEPVVDMERITLRFDDAERLLTELRELGRNAHPQRFAALRGRGWHGQLLRALQSHGTELTFEIIYGHALKSEARPSVQEETTVGLDAMRALLRQGRGNSPRR